jgi:NAD(P)H-dependent flavin oxidoreductase YrpB (nitropropane dioxygenase family)
MNVAAGPELAAAVTNAGGLGVIGGLSYSPQTLREVIHELKVCRDELIKPNTLPNLTMFLAMALQADLKDKNAPFGIDLLLPQVGGNARKTNYDYTKGKLDALVDVIIEEKAALFVSAVGGEFFLRSKSNCHFSSQF